MPAPAVIPAPIAYVKVVAVKTLVVAVGQAEGVQASRSLPGNWGGGERGLPDASPAKVPSRRARGATPGITGASALAAGLTVIAVIKLA